MNDLQTLTLEQALLLDQTELEDLDLSRDAWALTTAERDAAAALWASLLGSASGVDTVGVEAWDEAWSDSALVVALHRPAAEFIDWWRQTEWEHFGREGDAWAWSVLDRARRASGSLRELAGQLNLTAGLVRRVCAGAST